MHYSIAQRTRRIGCRERGHLPWRLLLMLHHLAFRSVGGLVGCVCLLVARPAAAADERPNILVIMSDDMGFSDIGCYGGEVNTPQLDALAAGGLRFTQFFNTARCCPTRASLLTGLYPHQAGVGHMMQDQGEQFPG